MPNRLKLLVAEDSQADVFLLERALRQTGVAINARFVSDGQEAVDYLEGLGEFSDRQTYPMPAVIMLDLKMPRFNGFDVLSWLKAQPEHRRTPVIIFSSSDDRRDIDRAYELGANCYVAKPGPTGDLPELLRILDAFWRRYVKLPEGRN
jgi:CheY-like chemotaxis protein